MWDVATNVGSNISYKTIFIKLACRTHTRNNELKTKMLVRCTSPCSLGLVPTFNPDRLWLSNLPA